MRKCFQNQFWTSGSAPIGKCMKEKVHVFWLGHFARSKIESESSFPIMYYIITIQKKNVVFRPIFNKVKNGFPIVFSNLARKDSGVFFQARKQIFCQMVCIYLLNSRVGPQCLDFVITNYSYPLILEINSCNIALLAKLFQPTVTTMQLFTWFMQWEIATSNSKTV